ncbi:hypothetical protein [Candidatus Formimonas warabiya]|uniref:Uncharacterized protein n=1 Tax=Formimonas warabiya TaxID=1761012 RepID=A0A3G1KPT5_FORW1|nr:hypothetical protein [Candidatus Formimonas warabiya]ATW24447.1 hypothetical protein DCMF_06325 [Candidatus Formimonas warabiya]
MSLFKKIDPDNLGVLAAWIVTLGDFLAAVAATELLKQVKTEENNGNQPDNSQLTELKQQIIQLQNEVRELKRKS